MMKPRVLKVEPRIERVGKIPEGATENQRRLFFLLAEDRKSQGNVAQGGVRETQSMRSTQQVISNFKMEWAILKM